MNKQRIAVIDYGMGNLHSVASALEHAGSDVEVLVTGDSQQIHQADKVVFPGVGAIRDCMAEIRLLGVDDILQDIIGSRPVLAICVGLQALMQHSEENGGVDCLGFFEGEVRYFGDHLKDANGEKLKVPHMGWNEVQQQVDHPLWAKIDNNSRFYFVHSYFVDAKDRSIVAGNCSYPEHFDAALFGNQLFAAQFHPEKSHTAGLQLLKNFIEWNGEF